MSEWFQAKVKFAKQLDNGIIKQSTELYLIDAVSFTDAETRAIKESQGSREVQAVAISRSPIKEVVFYGDTDQWHKVKVCYSLMDEDTEKEKKVTTYFLVNAATVKEAYDRTEEHLKGMLVPFTIPKVEESPICEVFQYEKQAPKGFVKATSSLVEQIGLTHDLRDRRDEVKLLFGDKYGEKISEWVQPLRDAMKKHNTTNPFKAVVEISKDVVLGDVGASLLIAVAVEMSEGNVADEEHEEDCAFEGDSVEVVVGNALSLDVPTPVVKISDDGSTIEFTYPTAEYTTGLELRVKSIDPTDGQAVAFDAMTLEAYLEDIRPTVTIAQIENIRDAYANGAHSLGLLSVVYGFTDEQAEMIADLCANDAAFEQDEEANDTDLESRLDAAMKGGGNGSIN